jgi:DNA-binding IclR family transcriptional regulator
MGWGRQEREIIEHGMTPEAVHLAALSEVEGWSATPAELASRMGRDRREVRRVLNRLVRAGWVRKGRDDAYAVAAERFADAGADLRHLRELRRAAPEREPPP